MEKKQKRFYKVGEVVWVVGDKKEGEVKSINRGDLTITVEVDGKKKDLKMWEIDKLKYKAKEKLVKDKKSGITIGTGTITYVNSTPTVYFAKVREDAIIPSKRDEDAGYDIYANIEAREVEGKQVYEMELPLHKTTLVPTGFAMAMPKTHYFNAKHERGSTGVISLSVLAGVIDSGYRDEVFVALTPLYKSVLITSEVSKVEELDNMILYPYSKAIAQGTIDLVPKVNIEEVSLDELQKMESERGTTKLGQSGK